MAKYIEREALIKELEADFNTDWADYASKDYINGVRDEYDDTLKIICQQKTADVQPVRHGYWEECEIRGTLTQSCSVCGGDCGVLYPYNFCPNCGARMDGET